MALKSYNAPNARSWALHRLGLIVAAYEFKCMVCGMTETITRDINADGDIAAPQCRGCMIPMERMWSLGGIQFKGTGWGHQ
jgi:predicted nucleic acid-binding Zn ribbon protein